MNWIDVKDRLPKPPAMVLIWTTISIDATLGMYIAKDWLYFSPHENFWISKEPHIQVLYWSDLPCPPTAILPDLQPAPADGDEAQLWSELIGMAIMRTGWKEIKQHFTITRK